MLEVRDVHKRYGDTRALDGINIEVYPGEVLGIAGPNGAGKTTLIRLLAGEDSVDRGEILIDGEPWLGLAARGTAVVHQEPQLFPNLSIVENLLVGREDGRLLRRPRAGREELATLEELEIAHVAGVQLGKCGLSIQQRTEIGRALRRDARLFLFDEPNSALTEQESDELFVRMRALAADNRLVILVSHRLNDLVEHADRVAVLRDGRCEVVLAGEDLTQEAIARRLVIEREEEDGYASFRSMEASNAHDDLLSLRNWVHSRGTFDVAAFSMTRGEIVAVVGVEGSGAREFVASAAGNEPAYGAVEIAGFADERGLRALTAYLSSSRSSSVFQNFSVINNVVSRLGLAQIATAWRWLRKRRMLEIAEEARTHFSIRCSSVYQQIQSLSGGNQQKVVIAAAMIRQPALLVADEPTRGVDAGSKVDIYDSLREFANAGNGILLHCTEVPEVFEIADRVLVMNMGRLSSPLIVREYKSVRALASDIANLERKAPSMLQQKVDVRGGDGDVSSSMDSGAGR